MLSKFTSTVNVILLDCCRETNVNKTFKGGKGIGSAKELGDDFRAKSKESEFLIGLACDPGTVAQANDNARNSRYTEALLKHLPVPGRTLEESMKSVTTAVYNKTNKEQRPWLNSCVMQRVVLVPGDVSTG